MKREFNVTHDVLASQGQRLLHYLLDNIVIYAIIIILLFLTAIICTLLGFNGIIDWIDGFGDLEWYLLYFSIMIGYYMLFEYFFSRTVAKFITQTIVVMKDGSKPGPGTVIKRTFCRIIPFGPFSFLGGNGRGWHDTIPEVFVVKKKEYEQKRELHYSFEEIGKTEEGTN